MKYSPTPCLSLVVILALIGCDSSSSLLPDASRTTLNLRIDAYLGTEPIPGPPRTLINFQRGYLVNDHWLTLRSAHMYISEITLIKADGTTHAFKDEAPFTFAAQDASGRRVRHTVVDKVLLFRHKLGQEEHFLGLVEAGSYKGIRFKLGLQGLTNRVEASHVSAAAHPLGSRDDSTNYWSPEKGFIFLRMDGKVDSNDDGRQDARWTMHLGTSEFVTTLEFEHDFTLTSGEPAEIHLKVDYAQFLAGLNYGNPDDRMCHTTDNLSVAQRVHAEIPRAFTFQGVQRVGTTGNQP